MPDDALFDDELDPKIPLELEDEDELDMGDDEDEDEEDDLEDDIPLGFTEVDPEMF